MLVKKAYEQPILMLRTVTSDIVTSSGGVRFNSNNWGEGWEDWNVEEEW